MTATFNILETNFENQELNAFLVINALEKDVDLVTRMTLISPKL